MSVYVQLQTLPQIASASISSAGYTHYNDGTTDFRMTIAQAQAILINALVPLGRPPQPSDLMMVQPSSLLPSCQVYFGQVGFASGTICWFYQATAPTYWQITGVGDSLLAVATLSGTSPYKVAGGIQAGTWQQTGVSLTIAQMPAHNHGINTKTHAGDSSDSCVAQASTSGDSTIKSQPIQNNGSGAAHDHGLTWRPLANVGILCQKML